MLSKHFTDLLVYNFTCDNNILYLHSTEEFYLHLNYTTYSFTQNLLIKARKIP